MKGIFTSLNLPVAFTFLATLFGFGAKATYVPVAIPATGTNAFTTDVIANGVGSPTTSTTSAFDNSVNCLVASNYQLTATSTLPPNSLPATVNSLNTTGLSYSLVNVTTAGNNALRLSGTASGMLDFTTQTYIGDIYVLAAAGDAGTTNVVAATVTVRFTDNTSYAFPSVNVGDWFNQTPVAIQGIGRVNRSTGVLDAASTSNPRLYEFKFTLPFNLYTKQIKGITVAKTQSQGTINVMAVTIDNQTCLPPAPTATGTTTVGTTINWAAITGSQGYEWALTTTATPPSGSGTTISALTYSPSGLFPGTTYYFWLRNKCSVSSFSIWSYVQFTTLPCPAAGAPTVGTNTPGTVTFSWPGTSTPGMVDYQYAVTTTSAAPTSWSTTNSTSATVSTGITPGATHYAQVRTNCSTTQSAWQSVSFVNPFPPCYAPATLTISNVNMHGANIVWNKSTTVPAAQDYQYVITVNPATPTTTTPVTTDTFYTATQLLAGTKYYVWIRTHCSSTNYSGWVRDSFTTPVICATSTTPNITNVTANSADISWQNFPGIYGYEYLIDFNPNSPTIPAVPISFNAVAPTNLASGTTYYFHLRTRCDTFNFSPWINEAFVTTPVCTDPSNLSMTGGTATTATFSWQAVPGAQNYQYSVTTGTAPVPGNTYTTGPNVTAIGLTPGTPYNFHVRAWCSGSDSSSWVSIPFNTFPTSVGNVSGNNGFMVSIYPNPAKDLLTIQTDGVVKGKGIIGVYDLSGKLMKQTGISSGKSQLDISGLGSGMYLLRYTDNETSGMMRIQKL